MAEDIAKQSDNPLSSRHMAKPEFSAHRTTPESKSRLGRILNKINRFFSGPLPPKRETRLEGRIHQLHGDISKSIDKLLMIKDELQNEIDPQIISLISMIVDPLIKEIHRLRKGLQNESVAQQVKASKGFSEWIEKAKMWIELCSKRPIQKEALSRAVVDHAVQEFQATIDKDLQVIQDYLNHTMDRIEIDDIQKNELNEKLEPELSQNLIELLMLKNHPQDLTVHTLQMWRAEADLSRENCFGSALHTIDLFTDHAAPARDFEEKIDHYNLEIAGNLLVLEERIARLDAGIAELKNTRNKELKKICIDELLILEQDAHELNSNLRLSHEHVERIQHSMEALAALHSQII